MHHIHHGATGTSGTSFLLTVLLALVALLYLRGWLRLRADSSDRLAPWRAVSFFVGLLFGWAPLATSVAALDEQLLTAHMIQHLLLMTFAPPLIWLGEPVKAFWHGLPQGNKRAIAALLHHPPVARLGTALVQPAFCLLAASAVLVVWHIPSVFAFGMESPWHSIEQASFAMAGLLFWWPVVQPWPSASLPGLKIILYLFVATLPCDILSGFLVFCDRVVYAGYSAVSQPLGFSALTDQQCAGALMWTCVTLVYLVAAAVVTMRMLSPDGSRSDEMELLESDSTQRTPRVVEAF